MNDRIVKPVLSSEITKVVRPMVKITPAVIAVLAKYPHKGDWFNPVRLLSKRDLAILQEHHLIKEGKAQPKLEALLDRIELFTNTATACCYTPLVGFEMEAHKKVTPAMLGKTIPNASLRMVNLLDVGWFTNGHIMFRTSMHEAEIIRSNFRGEIQPSMGMPAGYKDIIPKRKTLLPEQRLESKLIAVCMSRHSSDRYGFLLRSRRGDMSFFSARYLAWLSQCFATDMKWYLQPFDRKETLYPRCRLIGVNTMMPGIAAILQPWNCTLDDHVYYRWCSKEERTLVAYPSVLNLKGYTYARP